ncbi:MAG TPA: deoxyribodipyrimidine photo-lyase [Steroidobacteraceae bacterium]|nr:deoxyribodipyrimidine photo-lyase [Steroidobacteraceae bacterium]
MAARARADSTTAPGGGSGGGGGGGGATIVWFRQDLRLRDNPALHAAAARGRPVIPVYIWSPEEEGDWAPGSASRWWLHHSLIALNKELREHGSRLILARGPALQTLEALAAEAGATAVHWNRRYEPAALECSRRVAEGLRASGIAVNEFNSALLVEPEDFANRSGRPYQVYSAFQRALLTSVKPVEALPAPRELRAPRSWPKAVLLGSLQLLPEVNWYKRIEASWRPGESGAHSRLSRFIQRALPDYRSARDRPAVRGTSGLSPHLHFGEIGPRQIWHALGPRGRASMFLHEIVWREFAHHLLYHFPQTPTEPLRSEFARFPWRSEARRLSAWQGGRTGVPLVDAGMRQLWATGWMHNRVRMVVGSFLVKNLLIGWESGARWFWDTLVDADLANNTLNWQWVAGCGADAAPYFRIFNPLTQAEKFDPQGEYVARWVPELAGGRPAEDSSSEAHYPQPIVDLKKSREAALEAYESMRRSAQRKPRLS